MRVSGLLDAPHSAGHDTEVTRLFLDASQLSHLALLEPEPMVERQSSRPPRHYAERHGGPGYVHGPAVRHGKFDHESHYQECAGSQSGRQAENEKDGKDNFGGADEECHGPRCRK